MIVFMHPEISVLLAVSMIAFVSGIKVWISIFYRYAGQSAAAIERPAADGGDGVGNCDVGQATTKTECYFVDGSDGVGDGDACQAAAVRERFAADGSD